MGLFLENATVLVPLCVNVSGDWWMFGLGIVVGCVAGFALLAFTLRLGCEGRF